MLVKIISSDNIKNVHILKNVHRLTKIGQNGVQISKSEIKNLNINNSFPFNNLPLKTTLLLDQ